MKYLTAGESHGEKINVIVDDVPFGIPLCEDDVDFDLVRRSKTYGRSSRQDAETNACKITSGVKDGYTTGAPINIEIFNASSKKEDVADEAYMPRPGHADLNAVIKYNLDDCDIVAERASARETAARVAAGTVAKNLLAELGAEVYSYVWAIGSEKIKEKPSFRLDDLPCQAQIAMSKVMCPDEEISQKMMEQIDRASKVGDTLGGGFRLVAVGLVPGLGAYTQACKRINSKIFAAISSIPSVKAVEIGDACFISENVGSAVADAISFDEAGNLVRTSNYCGGVEGGMTNGMPLIVTGKVKPVPSYKRTSRTIDLRTMEQIVHQCNRRSDVCVVPSIAVVSEAELAIVLANEYMLKFGCDTINEIKFSLDSYKQKIKSMK